jgi:hypothetical protein
MEPAGSTGFYRSDYMAGLLSEPDRLWFDLLAVKPPVRSGSKNYVGDTIVEGLEAHCQLPCAHWIYFMIMKSIELPSHSRELEDSPTEFLVYRMTSAIDGRRGNRVLRQVRCAARSADMDVVDEQDEAIRAV